MKTKYIGLLAAMVIAALTSCQSNEPFDTQSPDDQPLILVPYETKSGQINLTEVNPETPLVDSVIVTPSQYTTVNWYLDDQLVFTGTKINMCFLAGKYALTIEAVTQAGKRTSRSGTLTVNPGTTDPYSGAPAEGRHFVPGMPCTLNGSNLSTVTDLDLTSDVFGTKVIKTITPTAIADDQITFALPEIEDGAYYVRLKDASGKRYGADKLYVHNGVLALSGYDSFVPAQEWVISGVNLQNVASVKVGDVEITNLVATATTVTLTAPDLALGEYTLSMRNKDGSAVRFGTDVDAPTEVTTRASMEVTLWTGAVTLDWEIQPPVTLKVMKDVMEQVPAGAIISIYFDMAGGEYHQVEVQTDWWDFEVMAKTDAKEDNNPISFTYSAQSKEKVEAEGSMQVVGFGVTVTKITYK